MVENWNSANDFILYGRGGEIATNRIEDQEATMLSLHLLQNRMIFVNTLMIQRVLSEPIWAERMGPNERRGMTPLAWGARQPVRHVLPRQSGEAHFFLPPSTKAFQHA